METISTYSQVEIRPKIMYATFLKDVFNSNDEAVNLLEQLATSLNSFISFSKLESNDELILGDNKLAGIVTGEFD